MGSAYLSEPITEKHVVVGTTKAFTFCMAEMQGTLALNQDGVTRWRTHLY